MGNSQADKARTHERVLHIAARRVREEGLRGPGVSEVMQEAGLTHGGFYKHFASREQMLAEAAALALADGEQKMAAAAASDERRPRAGLISAYLSTRHRDLPGKGCALVTLGAAAGRGDTELKDAYTAQVRNYLDLIAGASEDADAPQEEAMLTLSAIVGAVLVARAVSDPDLSDALLDTVARQLDERQPPE